MRVSQDVLDLFMRYGWPGNVRELKNVLAYAYCCMDDDAVELTPRYLPERLFMGSRSEDVHAAEEPGAFSFQAMQREAEKRAIESALSLAGGNKSKAGEAARIFKEHPLPENEGAGHGAQKEIDVKRPRGPSPPILFMKPCA